MSISRFKRNIDASDKVLGRLASQIAVLLMGKHKTGFRPNLDAGDIVIVKNIDKLRFTGQKMSQKIYYRHSGYLGGLKAARLEELMAKNPTEVLRRAVLGMLPKNKLRAKMIKRLKFS